MSILFCIFWFACAIASGLGACVAVSLALDGMRSAWLVMLALGTAGAYATVRAGAVLDRILLAWEVGR
jgi:hypothetical protein